MTMRNAIKFAALIIWLVASAIVSMPEEAYSAQTSCPPDLKLAELVAGSDFIVIGKMDVAKQRLADEAQKTSPDYLDIPLQVDGVVKGSSVGNATLRFYPKDAPYKPSNDAVLGLAGAPTLLFLTHVDDGPVGLYFAGHQPEALRPATEATIGTTRVEVLRQAQIIRSWQIDTALPNFEEVRGLIARLGIVSGDEQQQVFDRLETMGNKAVPAVIAQMDDRRALRTRAISLVNNWPSAFEGMRHYRPEQVVDGLDAILNQITGVSFGSIVNGGSNRQRDAAIAGWHVYAADLACRKPG